MLYTGNSSSEIRRNVFQQGPDLKIGKDHEYANHLGEALKDGERSPQAALGEIETQGLEFETKISVRTLYRYIDIGFILGVSNKDIPIKRSKDKKKGKPRATRNCKGTSIEERLKEVDGRETLGHWEMDTVVSKKGGSLARVLSITELMTHWQINVKIKTDETKSVIEVLDKLEKKLGEKFSFIFKTITVDNGSEFADMADMMEKGGALPQ